MCGTLWLPWVQKRVFALIDVNARGETLRQPCKQVVAQLEVRCDTIVGRERLDLAPIGRRSLEPALEWQVQRARIAPHQVAERVLGEARLHETRVALDVRGSHACGKLFRQDQIEVQAAGEAL